MSLLIYNMYKLNVFVYSVFVSVLMLPSFGCENDTRFTKEKGYIDPVTELENILFAHMFGNRTEIQNQNGFNNSEKLVKYPSGSYMRKEYFKEKKAVHAPFPNLLMLSGLNKLKITEDHMQTAVDAFAIICYGNLEDINELPPKYVLLSAQTISMMKVAREKFSAIWKVVKGSRHPSSISSTILELYRPLFQYLSAREMAQLNLSDDKILSFIGTHEDLTRHQVGVVVSAYIKQNPQWAEATYLNSMNNLICGLPINFMRKIPETSYLQISPEVFYHIRSCDEFQKRFLLAKLSRTQLYGKPFSWSGQEVSRLGLILTAVRGRELACINPEAFVGITSQVMKEMDPANLQYLNQKQINHLSKKAYNILAKKMMEFQTQFDLVNSANKYTITLFIIIIIRTICITVT